MALLGSDAGRQVIKDPDFASSSSFAALRSLAQQHQAICEKDRSSDTVHPPPNAPSKLSPATPTYLPPIMLYSYADWLTVEDPAHLQGLSTQYDEQNDDGAMQQTTHTPFAVPNKKQLSRPLFKPLAPPSPSAVDDLARSPRSFEELQRGSLSLATSIEEFNAIIDADMSDNYYQEAAANEPFPPLRSVPQLFGKLFFADSSSTARANASTGEIKYGWTPFDDGEFQFASVERDNAHSVRRW